MAGLGSRLHQTAEFTSLKDGELAVLCADSTSMSEELCAYTQQGYTFSMFLLDPYGPKGIPLAFVQEIINKRRHDVIINMPYQDLHKKTGMVSKASPTRSEISLMRHYDAMFGSNAWRDLVSNLDTEAIWVDPEAPLSTIAAVDPRRVAAARSMEDKLRVLYWHALQSVDSALAVKSIGLRFPDKERTMFYLYLTTHDPTGALAMNETLWKAGLYEHELRWRLRDTQEQAKLQAQGMSLLFELPPPVKPGRTRPSKLDVANHVLEMFRGERMIKREVYRRLADDKYFAREIDAALSYLQSEGLVSYNKPSTNDTLIAFM
jgi:three-Cys-motif partner protein